MGISICVDGSETFYIPVGHSSWMAPDEEQVVPPSDLFIDVQVPFVFHNAKFDIHVLRRAGVQIPEAFSFYDTMLMCHFLDENDTKIPGLSLQAMAKKYIGESKMKDLASTMKNTLKWEEIPGEIMGVYAEQDALVTYRLYDKLKPYFEIYEEAWKIDAEFLLLLEQIEARGLLLNVERCKELQALCSLQLEQLKEELGFDPAKTKVLHEKLFSLPPTGLGLKPITFTGTGKPQVNTSFLEKTNHPVCGLLLQFKETQKQLTSYYNSYLRLVGDSGKNSRIHASFKQHGTVTGRLSCADPNMQQIPRDSPIKSLFLPDPGNQLWEVDFKNIEMRLAAVYSQEDALLETFRAEGDVHQLTADLIGIDRQKAKMVNFLIIYGGGADALSYQLRLSRDTCVGIIKDYEKAYPKLTTCRRAAGVAALENGGWIKMFSGRRRHFRFSNDYHKAFNSIVQGGAFEIVKRAMLNLRYFDIRNQVHDSVWLNVRSFMEVREAERLMADWTEEMFGLKFSVESKRLS
jgi:DNA polymerase-1